MQRARTNSGPDLSALVPFVNASDESYAKLTKLVQDEGAVIHADELTIVSPLGEGGFGVVYKCSYTPPKSAAGSHVAKVVTESGGLVAVKKLKSLQQMKADYMAANSKNDETPSVKMKVEAMHKDALQEFAHEVLMLKKLVHPNVIGYIGCGLYADNRGVEELGLVLEYGGHGSLKDMIQAPGQASKPYTVTDGMRWAQDVARGMEFLHRCKPPIVHRDLKPGNVMLCGKERVAKVADFGLASFEIEKRKEQARRSVVMLARNDPKETSGQMSGKGSDMTGLVGSLRYMAPENFRGEKYTHKVDQFSFAIIMFELLMRERAYSGLYLPEEGIAQAVAGPKALRPALPKPWPEEVKALLEDCWSADPTKRPEFTDVGKRIAPLREGEAGEKILKMVSQGSKRGLLEKLGLKKSV